MRKLFFMFAIVATLFAVGCQKYNDKPLKNRVGELENRVAALEELCKKMNTNISSLQTIVGALQNNDYVTSVTPVTKNGETIGYTIAFSKSAPITIYHGENGKDGANGADGKDGINGADGKDGHTPVIGVRQDSDGVYYWTLDGEWLLDGAGNKVKAEGRDGQNGSDGKDGKDGVNGSDGKDGENGKDGADGKDGITPQLKIENGYWYVSTDNGATWTNLGKATGEDGKDGNSDESIFKSITQDGNNVYFTLSNDETIVLPKKQSLSITFAEGNSLQFDIDETKIVDYTITGGSNNNVVKAEMQNLDGAYTLRTTQTTATKGKITITANVPTENVVIVSVSNGSHTVMAAITVTIKPSIDENTITVETPGTLEKLIADYDKESITELTIIGNLNDSDITTLKNLPNLAALNMENVNLEKLQNSAFQNKTSLTDVKLPKTLKTIGNSAFNGCSSLTSVTIGSGVTAIGEKAFNCRNLTSVYITNIANWCAIDFGRATDSINHIYYNLYLNGDLIKDVVIPDGVKMISNYAFFNCSSLTSITIPDSVTSIGSFAFYGCSSLTSINIPDGVTSIGSLAFSGCSSLTSINIPDGVTTIRQEAFFNCSSLTSINIPDGVTSIGRSAFSGCSSLTRINIPDGVTSIDQFAFSGCSGLTSITIPDSVTSIGQNAFRNCTGECVINCNIPDYTFYNGSCFTDAKFTKIIVGDGVTTIGSYAFDQCSSLTSITIPNSVTSIGDNALYRCSSLTSIYCKAQTPIAIGLSSFNYWSQCTLYVPTGCKEAYATADYWKDAKEIIEVEF